MLNSYNENRTLFVGIDGGGSKCKAIVVEIDSDNDSHEIIGTGISGPANPLHGFEQATQSIVESVKLALKDAGLADIPLNNIVVGAGLAGVNLPVLFEQMSQWKHPFKEMHLATDLLIACLGAHDGKEGAVIIIGTGSCGFSYVNEQSLILGGHGFPHGDKGSGAWFGLQAAEQVLLSLDGLIASSLMNEKVLALHGVTDGIGLVEAIAGKPAAFYAQMANLVFDAADQGDDIANAIVTEGAKYISDVANQLWVKNPPRMSLIGGLSSRLQPWLEPNVQQRLSAPLSPPELGAVLFAQQVLSKNTTDFTIT